MKERRGRWGHVTLLPPIFGPAILTAPGVIGGRCRRVLFTDLVLVDATNGALRVGKGPFYFRGDPTAVLSSTAVEAPGAGELSLSERRASPGGCRPFHARLDGRDQHRPRAPRQPSVGHARHARLPRQPGFRRGIRKECLGPPHALPACRLPRATCGFRSAAGSIAAGRSSSRSCTDDIRACGPHLPAERTELDRDLPLQQLPRAIRHEREWGRRLRSRIYAACLGHAVKSRSRRSWANTSAARPPCSTPMSPPSIVSYVRPARRRALAERGPKASSTRPEQRRRDDGRGRSVAGPSFAPFCWAPRRGSVALGLYSRRARRRRTSSRWRSAARAVT